MNNVKPLLDFYRSDLSNHVKRLSEPLSKLLGIDSFCYQTNSSDGRYSLVSNTPDIVEFYYHHNSYKKNPYISHPQNFKTGADLPMILNANYRDAQELTNCRFGLGNILFLILKTDSICHIFGFSSTRKEVLIESIFLNHMDLLVKFRDYFLAEWSQHRNKIDNYTVNMGEIIGHSYFDRVSNEPASLSEERTSEFLSLVDRGSDREREFENSLIRKTLILIENNLSSPMNLKTLAKTVGASPSTLMRQFKKSKKQTLFSYIKERRMEQAMRLIECGKFSIADVAIRVGYGNFGAFSDAFKAQYNNPPSSYRPNSR